MKPYLLFSCVGTHDPTNLEGAVYDGALMHIVRHYQPRHISVFLSEGMLQRARADDRYNKSLDALEAHFQEKGIDYHPEREWLSDESITRVWDFDAFVDRFEDYVQALLSRFPDHHLLLNISSGTPQMKSTLCLLAVDNRFSKRVTPVQVASPAKGPNPGSRAPGREDIETALMINEDNRDNVPSRCSEPMLRPFRRTAISKLLASFDYEAALAVAEADYYHQPVLCRLIEIMKLRRALQYKEAKERYDKLPPDSLSIKAFPTLKSDVSGVLEYTLVIDCYRRNKQLADMVFRLNPLMTVLAQRCLLVAFGYDIEKALRPPQQKLSSDWLRKFYPQLAEKAEQSIRLSESDKPLSLWILVELLRAAQALPGAQMANRIDAEDIRFIEDMETLNNKARNDVAHSMKPLTLEKYKQAARRDPDKTMDGLFKLMLKLYPETLTRDMFNIYATINEELQAML